MLRKAELEQQSKWWSRMECCTFFGVAGFALSLTLSRLLESPTPHSTSQHTMQLFLQVHSAKVQMILRSGGSGVGGVAGFAPTPNFELTCGFKKIKLSSF